VPRSNKARQRCTRCLIYVSLRRGPLQLARVAVAPRNEADGTVGAGA